METLKNRLFVTEHYRLLHGVEHAYWPHYMMRNMGNHLWKFKLNYGVKAFFIYQVAREVQHYKHLNRVSFMSTDEQMSKALSICWCSLLATGVCLAI